MHYNFCKIHNTLRVAPAMEAGLTDHVGNRGIAGPDRLSCGKIFRVKRFHRWVFNGLAALSLVLCLAAVGLWVCSYSHFYNAVCYQTDGRTDRSMAFPGNWELCSWRGQIRISKASMLDPQPYLDNPGPLRPKIFLIDCPPPTDSPSDLSSFGFRFDVDAGSDECDWFDLGNNTSIGFDMGDKRTLIIPLYAPVALCVIPMFFWLRSYLRRKALIRSGLCVQCGYDLRATPDRCPECGKIVERAF